MCGQVSCSWHSAIYWCNDEDEHGLRLKNFADIADGARAVLDECSHSEDGSVAGIAVTGTTYKSMGPGKGGKHEVDGEGKGKGNVTDTKEFDPAGKNWSVVVIGDDSC